ncbi:MAG: cell division protein FtsA [Chloroflexi bacterium]|nr:cell division protein FtsA [Chloroflexota bacterium]
MVKEQFYAATDPGTSKIVTVVAKGDDRGRIEVLGVGKAPSKGIDKGVVNNIQEAGEAVHHTIVEASTAAGLPIPWVYLGIGGSHIQISTRWGSARPSQYGSTISYEHIQQAANWAYPADLPPEREVIHLLPKSYSLDGVAGIRNPLGMHAIRLDLETLAITGATTPMQSLVRSVERNGVRVRGLVLETLAAGEAVLTKAEKEMGVLLVDIGGGTTGMAVYQKGVPAYVAILPVGGNNFTNDLAYSLRIPFEDAEEAKIKYGSALPDIIGLEDVELPSFGDRGRKQVDRRELCRLLRDRADELLRLVRYKARQAGFTTLPAGVVLTGGASSLHGMDTTAKVLFSTPVRVGAPLLVDSLPKEMAGPAYSTAVGILLWATMRAQEQQHRDLNGDRAAHKAKVADWLREKVRRVAL